MLAALLLALLLARPHKGVGAYRAAVYLPTVIPEVAYALLWLWIVNPLYGPLNWVLRGLGLPAPAWLVNPETAKWVFVMMSVFQIGESFVVLLAGLKTIPATLYDAATVDGASPWQAFRYLTLPLLAPWLILLIFRDAILSFQNTFTPNLLMTGGDPYYATLFLPLLIYEEAFDHFRLGIGAAMIVLLFAVTAVFVLLLYSLLPQFETDHDL
jgi:multiple sugar transport system permease protein